ncbi:beta-1,3-glucanase family protein [Xanthocytophaga flava]|uniref:beta-1,3-glucanase family protein n=1 Tax=Xanthocytophaga flava TaxID=3048013 RepID=UPI0028D3F39C|nr:beta-1,3-glucanase family protein [Xanthocytophaga flavus]MDJ1471052.1 beta-1,3-glucanase family protein [Xanthocytophaga flavus]
MKKNDFFDTALIALRVVTLFAALLVFPSQAWSQTTVPFTLANNSTYADANVYVAVVGIVNGNHSWIDCKTSTIHTMSTADNTVQGPIPNGDAGPGGNGKYANCFAKLSEIPNKTITIPGIAGCRILISFQSQLYLYFFGASSGYAAPNLANPNDPNQGIRYEVIELTNASNGLWANTTRVDSYQYPMGLEVWGNSNFYKKVGEQKTHSQIISQWQTQAPSEFQGCLDVTKGIIHFPSKTSAFQTGGAQANFFKTYIDAIWAKYATADLVFNAGDAGTWRGRVSGSAFVFTRTSDGQVATIAQKPTTIETMEGSGALASGGQWDKVVQAQICAAINRHAINLNLASGATQDFSSESLYYVTSPYNWYCKFWHQTDISYNGRTYAFCYDDVFDKSSTINASSPISAKITIGGFANTSSFSSKIEAENYGYMSGISTETTTDAGGGLNVGWIDAGDWMSYSVTIPATGSYTVSYRVASPNSNTTLRLEKDAGATQLGSVTIPNTGGWQNWSTVSHTITLPAGSYSIGIATTTGGFNLNYLTITGQSSARIANLESVVNDRVQLVLSPNPATEQFQIAGLDRIKRVKVYDLQGKEVLAVENPGNTINIQSLSPGLHIAIIEGDNTRIYRQKLVKK